MNMFYLRDGLIVGVNICFLLLRALLILPNTFGKHKTNLFNNSTIILYVSSQSYTWKSELEPRKSSGQAIL